MAGKLGVKRQDAFEKESIKQILDHVTVKAKEKDPFFVYWATYANQLTGAADFQGKEHVDPANAQASMMAQHSTHVGKLLDHLKALQIEENTLVVWWSDNGPMYAFWPTAGKEAFSSSSCSSGL